MTVAESLALLLVQAESMKRMLEANDEFGSDTLLDLITEIRSLQYAVAEVTATQGSIM